MASVGEAVDAWKAAVGGEGGDEEAALERVAACVETAVNGDAAAPGLWASLHALRDSTEWEERIRVAAGPRIVPMLVAAISNPAHVHNAVPAVLWLVAAEPPREQFLHIMEALAGLFHTAGWAALLARLAHVLAELRGAAQFDTFLHDACEAVAATWAALVDGAEHSGGGGSAHTVGDLARPLLGVARAGPAGSPAVCALLLHTLPYLTGDAADEAAALLRVHPHTLLQHAHTRALSAAEAVGVAMGDASDDRYDAVRWSNAGIGCALARWAARGELACVLRHEYVLARAIPYTTAVMQSARVDSIRVGVPLLAALVRHARADGVAMAHVEPYEWTPLLRCVADAVGQAPSQEAAQLAWRAMRGALCAMGPRARCACLRALVPQCPYPAVSSLLVGLAKDSVHAAWQPAAHPHTWVFTGRRVGELVKAWLPLMDHVAAESLDVLSALLNLLRYVYTRDTRASNATGLWEAATLQRVRDTVRDVGTKLARVVSVGEHKHAGEAAAGEELDLRTHMAAMTVQTVAQRVLELTACDYYCRPAVKM